MAGALGEGLSAEDGELLSEILDRNNWQGLLLELVILAQGDVDEAQGMVEEMLLAPRKRMVLALEKAAEEAELAGEL